MNYLSKTKGFDSKEYKDYSSGLAEGDEEMQKSITNILKRVEERTLTKWLTKKVIAVKKLD